MNRWRATLNVSDVFHNDAMTISEKAGVIADRIKGIDWDDSPYVAHLADCLREQDEAKGFNGFWDLIYDEADHHRVWVVTR